jgi:hypothetical protein
MLNRSKLLFLITVTLLALGSSLVIHGQQTAPVSSGVLWEPVDISTRDLRLGPGGRAMQPSLSRVTFLRKDTGGNNPKYRIRDASGHEWVAKVADESQAEVAAVRLLWGIGYKTEINYIAPQLRIPRVGVFRNASLEARPANHDRGERWKWDDNPFNGSNEMAGLRIMMAMINNWDLKDGNNIILKTPDGVHYVISDLGSSFGKPPVSSKFILNRVGRSVNDPQDYVRSDFIKGAREGEIDFAYKGKGVGLLEGITLEQGRWLADLLLQLSDRQIADAFRAANYRPAEVRALSGEFRSRINDLDRITRRTVAKVSF